MKLLRHLLPVALLAVHASTVAGHELTRDQLASVRFDQRIGAQVPLDLAFRDDTGTPVTLGAYFSAQKPVILTLNYFHCQNLCPLELEALASTLNAVPFTVGSEFDVVSVSIDPREGPTDAATSRQRTLRGYNRRDIADGWRFLTGDVEAIGGLAQSVGFTYAYDADANEFAHPLGAVLLTPDGHISRYLFGLDYAANDVRLALIDASEARLGSLLDRAILLCYHYDPLTGRYTPLALNLLRGGGAAGAVGVLLFLGWLWRTDRRRDVIR